MKIQDIIDKFDKDFPEFIGVGSKFPIFKETPNRQHIKQFLQSSLTSLLDSIEKELPKERGLDKESGCRGAENRRYNKGWNKCRQEVINIINSHKTL